MPVFDDDIAGVLPHLREMVRDRLTILARYSQGSMSAKEAAAVLGMSIGSFHHLHRAWRIDPTSSSVRDAKRTTRGRSYLDASQKEVIAAAAAERPNAIPARIVERAVEIARQRGVEMPSVAAMSAFASRTLVGIMPAGSPLAAVDVVVEHAVVALPVAAASGLGAFMPLATIAIAVSNPKIVALALHEEVPTARATAAVVADAIDVVTRRNDGAELRSVFMDRMPGPEWHGLACLLSDAGVRLEGGDIVAPRPPVHALRLVGMRPDGVRLVPRSARRPFLGRPAPLNGIPEAMSLEAAERFLRARWTSETDGLGRLPQQGDTADLDAGLQKALREWAANVTVERNKS